MVDRESISRQAEAHALKELQRLGAFPDATQSAFVAFGSTIATGTLIAQMAQAGFGLNSVAFVSLAAASVGYFVGRGRERRYWREYDQFYRQASDP